MKRVCAWCKKGLDGEVAGPSTGFPVTHGICLDCAQQLFTQAGLPLRRFLDRLGAPVMVVDPAGKVTHVNDFACCLLRKEEGNLVGRSRGVALDCANAKLPGGCGGDVNCTSCAVRSTVMETLSTGKSFANVQATLKLEVGDEARYLISSEKVNGAVLLRVDPVDPT